LPEYNFFDESNIQVIQVKGGLPISTAIQKYPDLIPFLKSLNPPRLDFKDRRALLSYNIHVAKELYGLDIVLDIDQAIIPAPVLRYNFLLNVLKPNSVVIELGTGASAIIAMLAAKHFNASVNATELDSLYLKMAMENVKRNNLRDRVNIVDSKGKLLSGVFPDDFRADFIISNPPFYDEIRSEKIIWGGKDTELVGGNKGESFILQMIEEGWHFLKNKGIIAFFVPKTRKDILNCLEQFLES